MHNLKEQPVWVNWKLINNKKRPFSAITGHETGTSPEHAGEWTDYSKAVEKLKSVNNGNTDRTKCIKHTKNGVDGIDGSCGVGFIVPEGYFFLDVDHQKKDSPIVQELMSALPTYAEVSPSGNGVHFYGKCDLSKLPIDIMDSQNWDGKNRGTQKKLSKDYYTKNPHNGIELYIGGLTNRFSTFTGDCISETEELIDCTKGLLKILEAKMKKCPQEAQGIQYPQCPHCPQGCDDGAEFVQLGEDDIPQIISDLRKQKNGSKFISLFDEGEIPAKKTQSEADISLCAMIAFRTGPDPDLINSIFRQSVLYRPKWDREDYATRTIEAGIEACHGNFHPTAKKNPNRPPFLIMKKGKAAVSTTKLAAYVKEHVPFIIVRDSAKSDARIYVYRSGVYTHYAKDVFTGVVKSFIEDFDQNLVKMNTVHEAVAPLCNVEQYVPSQLLNSDIRFISLQNGLLDIGSMKLLPHDPNIYSTVQLPLVYDPNNTATPTFDRYLDTLTDGASDKKQLLLEFLGACLSNVPGHYMKKALFMYGPGDSGKSQIKRLAELLLGEENYTGIDFNTNGSTLRLRRHLR